MLRQRKEHEQGASAMRCISGRARPPDAPSVAASGLPPRCRKAAGPAAPPYQFCEVFAPNRRCARTHGRIRVSLTGHPVADTGARLMTAVFRCGAAPRAGEGQDGFYPAWLDAGERVGARLGGGCDARYRRIRCVTAGAHDHQVSSARVALRLHRSGAPPPPGDAEPRPSHV